MAVHLLPQVSQVVVLLILLVSLLIPNSVVDEQLWTSFELEKEISPVLELEAEQQLRLKNQYAEFHKTFTDLSLTYKAISTMEVTGKLRYIRFSDKEEWRTGLSQKFTPDIHSFIPAWKFAVQRDFSKNAPPENFILRNKLIWKTPFTKLFSVSGSYEIFHEKEKKELVFEKYRYSIALERQLKKNQSVELFYTYNGEVKKSEMEVTNIIGVKYEYSL